MTLFKNKNLTLKIRMTDIHVDIQIMEKRERRRVNNKRYDERNYERLHEIHHCLCGGSYTFLHRASHKTSKKHQMYELKKSILSANEEYDKLRRELDEIKQNHT